MRANTCQYETRRDRNPRRCSTEECHHRADSYLTNLIGTAPDDLSWDPIHQLQGHAHLGTCELVVIAPRDTAHETVVLTVQDWDEFRRTEVALRTELLELLAIHDHAELVAAVAGHSSGAVN